jgi:tryptophan synthase beta chain
VKTPFGSYPDSKGYFGPYGGRFVAETLMAPILELDEAYRKFRNDAQFQQKLAQLLTDVVGRATPLTHAARLSETLGGAQIYLKREDLCHLGAHKINNSLGQALLAQNMGKKKVIAETGAGQHGVATAAAAALFGMSCTVYMGTKDMQRQALNVSRMKLLGAEVVGVQAGTCTLKDAINEAMRDWVENFESTYYIIGSVLGPHPYPGMVRDFQSIIGREAREQILRARNRLPSELVACVGGGSNAIGLFTAFLDDSSVVMTGVEAGGKGITSGQHAARFASGSEGVLHGTLTYLLQDDEGRVLDTHSISAGLDYPSIGPEHAFLKKVNRAQYTSATDAEALSAFQMLAKTEGILPALESSHALAYAVKRAPQMSKDEILLVNLSGRGDKDMEQIHALMQGGKL